MAKAKISIRKEFKVMQCRSCASPLHYDASVDGFVCSTCGSTYPYEGDDGVEETSFQIMHVPLKTSGDLIDLSGLEKIMFMDDPYLLKQSANDKWYSNQSYLERRKRVNYQTRKMFMHTCPMCGGDVQAFENQNVWNCDFCGNRFAKEEIMATGDYEVCEVVDTGEDNTPHYCIPFEISREEAQERILSFASLRPKAFAGIDLEKRVQNLWTVYVPADLCDISLLIEIMTENGSVQLFQDRVNGTPSLSDDHSFHLFADLAPWDLSKIVPFSKKLAEGDLQLDKYMGVGIPNERSKMSYILRPELMEDVKKMIPSEDRTLRWTRIEVRNRKMVMMPVYFLEREETGPKIRFMVNGQTGAVSVLGCGQMPGHKTLFTAGKDISPASERFMTSELIPVVPEGDNGMYRKTTLEDAFRTSKRKIKFADAKRRNKKKRKKAIKAFFDKLFRRKK